MQSPRRLSATTELCNVDIALEDLQAERLKRDLAFLYTLDAGAAKAVEESISSHTTHPDDRTAATSSTAAVRIQSCWRRIKAKRRLTELLWEKFTAEEAQRRQRELEIVNDTWQLLDRLELQHRLANEAYLAKCRRNHQNRYMTLDIHLSHLSSVAYSIQSTFRRHVSKKRLYTAPAMPGYGIDGVDRPDSS
ncbi:hypothetical protein AC1031_012567 [Aphanomyces cochlioides]|nr:hypothetical protein AC1031_012567 [Aphanomyces cochlioides]